MHSRRLNVAVTAVYNHTPFSTGCGPNVLFTFWWYWGQQLSGRSLPVVNGMGALSSFLQGGE